MLAIIVINVILASIELYNVYEMSRQLSKNKPRLLICATIVLLRTAFIVFYSFYTSNVFINLISGIIFLFAFTFVFEMSFYKRILSTVIFIVVSLLLEYAVTLFVSILTNIPIVEIGENILLYALAAISTKFATYTLIRILFKVILQQGTLSIRKYNLLNLIMPLSTLVAVIAITIMSYSSDNNSIIVFAIVSTLVLLVANISSFMIYESSVVNSVQIEKERNLNIMMQLKQKELNSLINRQILANKEIHEVKHKIYNLRAAVSDDNIYAINLVDELCNIYKNKDVLQYTTIKDLDILLNVKRHIADEKGLSLKYNINICGEILIASMDLCMIIGNLLDNSIEHTTGNEIELTIKTYESYLSVKCVNDTAIDENTVNYIEQVTSKNNNNLMHGYGLLRIDELSKKYEGTFEKIIENHKFIVAILLKN